MYSHSTGFLLFKDIACSCDRGSLRQHLKHCLIYCVAGLRSFVLSSKSIEPTQHARIELAAKAHGQLLLAPAQACARVAGRCSSSEHWKRVRRPLPSMTRPAALLPTIRAAVTTMSPRQLPPAFVSHRRTNSRGHCFWRVALVQDEFPTPLADPFFPYIEYLATLQYG